MLLLFVLAPLVTAVALPLGLQAPAEAPADTKADVRPLQPPQDERPKQVQEPRDESNAYVRWIISLVCTLVGTVICGGLAGAVVTSYLSWCRSRRERRMLVVAFCCEFLQSYGRCVGYLGHAADGVISYSTLYTFTDASMLARYAAVCEDPKVITAIVEIKSIFFQIGRYVEQASLAAHHAAQACEKTEEERLRRTASHEQGIALSFFRDHAKSLRENILLLLITASHDVSDAVIHNLEAKYNECKQSEDRLRSKEPQR